MIASFISKGLAELWASGMTRRINTTFHRRLKARLYALDAASRAQDMNLPGFDFHALSGFTPTRYSVHVNGPWCVTFSFETGHASDVDFEQYH
jgi:proteic killer suppression protein